MPYDPSAHERIDKLIAHLEHNISDDTPTKSDTLLQELKAAKKADEVRVALIKFLEQ